MPIRRFLSIVPGINIKHATWKQVVYKQASEIIRGNGINNEVKPVLKNFTIELNQNLFDVQWNKEGEFDGFVRVRLPFVEGGYKNRAKTICLPFKHHSYSLKYKKWTLLRTVKLKIINGNFYLFLLWEKEAKSLRKTGKIIGFDSGYRHFLAGSNGKFYGSEMKAIYEKLANQNRGSKNYQQTLAFRDDKIKEVLNKLPISTYKQVVVEDLKNVKRKSKLHHKINNRLQYWSYLKSTTKLERLCEEHGVLLSKVNPAYTSQCCPNCGFTARSNRNAETFLCGKCGYTNHADVVGAINVLNRAVYGGSTTNNLSFSKLRVERG